MLLAETPLSAAVLHQLRIFTGGLLTRFIRCWFHGVKPQCAEIRMLARDMVSLLPCIVPAVTTT